MKQSTHTGNFSRLLRVGALLAFLALLAMGAITGNFLPQRSAPVVHLQTQPQFKVKRHSELLGVNVMQITDKREPQDFLVLNNVPMGMVDPMFGKEVDKGWATDVANQFLKKRDPDSTTAPPTVEIQEIKTTQQGTVMYEGKELPYWQVQVRFKIGQEAESRYYEGGIIRKVGPDNGKSDTLILAYAQKGAFRKELLPELLRHLSFEKR